MRVRQKPEPTTTIISSETTPVWVCQCVCAFHFQISYIMEYCPSLVLFVQCAMYPGILYWSIRRTNQKRSQNGRRSISLQFNYECYILQAHSHTISSWLHTHTHVQVSEDCPACKVRKGVKYVEIRRVSTCPIMLVSLAKKLCQQLKRNSINAPFALSICFFFYFTSALCVQQMTLFVSSST